MTYNDGQWEPIRETRNNGDGTVTCLFEHLCPVAFFVEERAVQTSAEVSAPLQNEEPPQPDNSGVAVWAGIGAAVAAVLAAVVAAGRKKRVNQR